MCSTPLSLWGEAARMSDGTEIVRRLERVIPRSWSECGAGAGAVRCGARVRRPCKARVSSWRTEESRQRFKGMIIALLGDWECDGLFLKIDW
jgi:hypothetical protein